MADIIAICREAWASTKKDVAFDDLSAAYREGLIARAEKVDADKRVSNEGADIFRQFEQTVLELLIPERFHPDSPAPETVMEPLEPEEAKHLLELKGALPKDFPAYDKLHEAGINTYGQLAKCENLTEIDGIGPMTIKQITKRLKSDTKELNK